MQQPGTIWTWETKTTWGRETGGPGLTVSNRSGQNIGRRHRTQGRPQLPPQLPSGSFLTGPQGPGIRGAC